MNDYSSIAADRVLHTWAQQRGNNPEILVDAKGSYYRDATGRRYLDFASQLGFANIGHGDKRIRDAITDDVWNVATLYGPGKASVLDLIDRLLGLLPDYFARVFLGLNGSDAVEAALKIARLVTGRQDVVSFHYAYHGSSAGAISVGGLPRNRVGEGVPGTVFALPPYHYRSPLAGATQDETDLRTVEFLRDVIRHTGPDNIAAVIGEPITGSGAGVVPGRTYWKMVKDVCSEFGILLIADEVITGFGRTGHWFARDHYDFEPDILVLGKGLTSGYLPLSATVISDVVAAQLEDRFLPHGLTNSFHAVCSAAALANIDVIESDDLVENAGRMGSHLDAGLRDLASRHACIGDVRQLGLFVAVEIVQSAMTREVFPPSTQLSDGRYGNADMSLQIRAAMLERGVRITAFRSSGIVALVPPLPIGKQDVDIALDALDEVLSSVDELVDG